jgi:GT2 family glycosyltransferase
MSETPRDAVFAIIIPTWNNLALLRLCVDSICRHSVVPYEIVLHVNDGSDGSLEWVRSQGIAHTHSEENIGICLAVNRAVEISTAPYLVYLNDDMVCCPGWDSALLARIQSLNSNAFMISGTMIEPRKSGNACVLIADYGSGPENFNEAALLADQPKRIKQDWYGATWPPSVVHREWWNKVGGYSVEFSPGMSSDNDFSMKLWAAGCRIFLGVGASQVYHFMSRSTGKVVRNNGRKQFLHKWGMTQNTFDVHFLRRGQAVQAVVLPEPVINAHYTWDRFRGLMRLMWWRF